MGKYVYRRMIALYKVRGYRNFKYFGEDILKNTIEQLYNCSIVIWNSTIEKFEKKYIIDYLFITFQMPV